MCGGGAWAASGPWVSVGGGARATTPHARRAPVTVVVIVMRGPTLALLLLAREVAAYDNGAVLLQRHEHRLALHCF